MGAVGIDAVLGAVEGGKRKFNRPSQFFYRFRHPITYPSVHFFFPGGVYRLVS